MLRFFLVLSAFIWSATALADTTRIATWNLGGFHAIPDAKVARIVEGLRILNADVVVLVEVNPLEHAQTIANELSEEPGECYQSAATDQRRARQEIAIVYKCDVELTSHGLLAGSDLDKQGYRSAVVAHMRVVNFDFALVGLHLKAGRGSSNRALRNQQNAYISGFIQGVLLTGEQDVLVVGDYNMIPGRDNENFASLNADGSLRIVSSEDLTGSFSHISNGNPGNLLDGYAFTNLDPAEYVEASVEIVQMHQRMGLSLAEYDEQVTDHLPVVAVFDVSVDND